MYFPRAFFFLICISLWPRSLSSEDTNSIPSFLRFIHLAWTHVAEMSAKNSQRMATYEVASECIIFFLYFITYVKHNILGIHNSSGNSGFIIWQKICASECLTNIGLPLWVFFHYISLYIGLKPVERYLKNVVVMYKRSIFHVWWTIF
jgi:hypothetical protein